MYKTKCHTDDNIERYKAWLVARGFSQQRGIDYYKTFSLVIKQAIIMLSLCMAWNKILEYGTLGLVTILSLLDFILLKLTHHYSCHF